MESETTKPKLPLQTITQEYFKFANWADRKMPLPKSETFVSGELVISTLEESFYFSGKLTSNPTRVYYQSQIQLVFYTSNQSFNKTNPYHTPITEGVNMSLKYPIITKKYIPMLSLTKHASLLIRISINGIESKQDNLDSISIDDIEIKISNQQIQNYIARMPSNYITGYEEMKKEHLKTKNGQVIIPELSEMVKKLLTQKHKERIFFQWYISKRKVFDRRKYTLIPKRKNRQNISKWNQYQSSSTTTMEQHHVLPYTVPDFEPTEEEIIHQLMKKENKGLISKWRSENKTKPECTFLVVPSILDQMRMKIINERENIYHRLKNQGKVKGILKIQNEKRISKSRKKITFNLNKNTTIICDRWIKQ